MIRHTRVSSVTGVQTCALPICDFVGENRAAICISSDILELISACDRFIVFYDGKVTATYDRSEITEEVLQYAIQNEC